VSRTHTPPPTVSRHRYRVAYLDPREGEDIVHGWLIPAMSSGSYIAITETGDPADALEIHREALLEIVPDNH
jgi:hypothetical protein